MIFKRRRPRFTLARSHPLSSIWRAPYGPRSSTNHWKADMCGKMMDLDSHLNVKCAVCVFKAPASSIWARQANDSTCFLLISYRANSCSQSVQPRTLEKEVDIKFSRNGGADFILFEKRFKISDDGQRKIFDTSKNLKEKKCFEKIRQVSQNLKI